MLEAIIKHFDIKIKEWDTKNGKMIPMKYQCYDCGQLFTGDNIIMISESSGWGYGVTNILCSQCFQKRKEEKIEKERIRNEPMSLKIKLVLIGLSIAFGIVLIYARDSFF